MLHDAGYRTALIGKPHFEPFLDPFGRFTENRFARDGHAVGGRTAASSTSSPRRTAPPGRCTTRAGWPPSTPRRSGCSTPCSTARWRSTPPAAATPARRRCTTTRSPREWYHTDWVADRTIAWLDSLDADDDWFCWMSFPDPHHPWDPPAVRARPRRLARRAAARPATSRIGRRARARPRRQAAPLAGLVRRQARLQLRGAARLGAGHADRRPGPRGQRPQRRRVRADRRGARAGAGGRSPRAGWDDDVDVVFTTDHGELQGDFGLLFKGPYHVDGLMRLPLIWRPAPSAGVAPAVVSRPVGLVDLAPTFCAIAGLAAPEWMEGQALPVDDADADARGLRAGADRVGQRAVRRRRAPAHDHPRRLGVHRLPPGYSHDGTEGELYDLADDPLQQVNRWDDPAARAPQRPGRRPVGPPAADAHRDRGSRRRSETSLH